jgi:hypothetical protein
MVGNWSGKVGYLEVSFGGGEVSFHVFELEMIFDLNNHF